MLGVAPTRAGTFIISMLVWAFTPASFGPAILELGMMMPAGPAVWAHAMLAQPKSSATAIASDAVECLICIEVVFLLNVFGQSFYLHPGKRSI